MKKLYSNCVQMPRANIRIIYRFIAYIFCNSYKMLVVLFINEKYYDFRGKKQQISSFEYGVA